MSLFCKACKSKLLLLLMLSIGLILIIESCFSLYFYRTLALFCFLLLLLNLLHNNICANYLKPKKNTRNKKLQKLHKNRLQDRNTKINNAYFLWVFIKIIVINLIRISFGFCISIFIHPDKKTSP